MNRWRLRRDYSFLYTEDPVKYPQESKHALDCKPYNTKKASVTWDTCTLRSWLNNEFINEAFTTAEKAKIPTVTVSADKNPSYYYTNPGRATQDKVFLLSIPEVNKYSFEKRCKATTYAKKNGSDTDAAGFCVWWLRSPGRDQDYAADVDDDGSVDAYGYGVRIDGGSVRPALWINLNS